MSRRRRTRPTGCSSAPRPDANRRFALRLTRLVPLFALLGLVACATAPRLPTSSVSLPAESAGARIAALATAQLGQPYRYGGDGAEGFDCSGLALYVHQQLGIGLPRTAREQRAQSAALDRSELQSGDLVFFTMGPLLMVDHVGIYLGEGRFVHAPRAGSPVGVARLDVLPFSSRFAGGARYWVAGNVRPVTVSESAVLTLPAR